MRAHLALQRGAENSSVWRSRAHILTILSTTGRKPMSSIRSASSSTSSLIRLSDTSRRSIRSSSRPGVATRMCARAASRACLTIPAPPYTAAIDSARACAIGAQVVDDLRSPARASARARARDGRASESFSRSTIGTPNASVLPDPVGRLRQHVVPGEHVGNDHASGRRTAFRSRARRARLRRPRTRRGRRTFDASCWWCSFWRPSGRRCRWRFD